MANIHLDAVTVDLPVYNARLRSLKNDLLHRGTGGRIGLDLSNRVCVRALEGVSLLLEQGERVGIVGLNGAGKTTLLRVLAGVYEPTFGQVRRQGRVTSLLKVGLNIDSSATGYENIMLRGALLGVTAERMRERMDEITVFAEIGEFLNMPVHTYSSGMIMRLAFAVCTSIDPEILLMDELLDVGDAAFVEKAERRLEELIGRTDILVLASHDYRLLERTCTTGILLDAGRVRVYGPIGEVLEEYKKTMQ